MTNFVFAYRGGTGTAATPEEQERSMAEWGAWFGTLGQAIVETGNAFGGSLTVNGDGSSTEGAAAGLGGYTVVTAPSLSAAADLAKGCPLLRDGGTVEVYEALEM